MCTRDANVLTHFLEGYWETNNNFAAAHYRFTKYIHIFITLILKEQTASFTCPCSPSTKGVSFCSVDLCTISWSKQKQRPLPPPLFPGLSEIHMVLFASLRNGKKTKRRVRHNSLGFLFLWKGDIYLSKIILFTHIAEGRKDFEGRT